jgi:hypothetical protein
MSESNDQGRVEREARLHWVPVSLMAVSPLAQRELNQARVDHIVADFDLEQLGTPTVSKRDGHFYIIDGQHRVEALKAIGYTEQKVQCWTYEGLSETDEAEKFLKLNDTLTVNAMAKFRVGIQAGRLVECDIDRIVRAQNLRVSADKLDGSIQAVGTLRRIYQRAGARVLSRALRIVRDAYGDPGLESAVLDGIGYLCGRYNGELEDEVAVLKLSKALGGVNGLLNKAEVIRRETGNAKGACVAAAAVDIINAGRGGKKLPSWWRENEAAA